MKNRNKARQLDSVGLTDVFIASNDSPDLNELIRVPLDATFEFEWEIGGSPTGEHLQATFTGPQLLKLAAEHGMLRVTTSGERRVPKGIAAAQRVIANA